MILNKKNIFTFAASALMVFGLSANIAHADDATAGSDKQGDIKPSDGTTIGYYNQKGKATDGKTGSDLASGSKVEGKSDAHVSITRGYLSLNLVPSFGFGSVASTKNTSQTLKDVYDNNAKLQSDSLYGGLSTNKLSVSDSRYSSSNGDDNQPTNDGNVYATDTDGTTASTGYSVSASMGKLSPENGGTISSENSVDGASLALPGGVLESDSTSDVVQGQKNGLTLNGDGNASTVNNIIKATKVGTGNSSITFNKANLTLPAGIKAGSYAAEITWTLTPTSNAN